jgi:ferredoxin
VTDILGLKKSNCKNCYKCIRSCPVKSIRFTDHQAHIVKDECILCGLCFMSCPQNAKQIRNDVGKAKELIASGKPVYASTAPWHLIYYPII